MTDIPAAVQIGESVIFQKLKSEIIVLNMANQSYYELNEMGAVMWQTLIDRKTISAAADELLNVYDTDSTTLNKDLETLVRQLIGSGLLQPLS